MLSSQFLVSYYFSSFKELFLFGTGGHLLVPLWFVPVPLMMWIKSEEQCRDVNQRWRTPFWMHP
jgi:hypothetical protein